MTFKEKLIQEHPEYVGTNFVGGCQDCPRDYGYTNADEPCPTNMDCVECWNREMPPLTNAELADKIADTHHRLIERGINEGYAEKIILSLIDKEYFKK